MVFALITDTSHRHVAKGFVNGCLDAGRVGETNEGRTEIEPLYCSNNGLGDADASKSIGPTPSLTPTGSRSRFLIHVDPMNASTDPCVKTSARRQSIDLVRLCCGGGRTCARLKIVAWPCWDV